MCQWLLCKVASCAHNIFFHLYWNETSILLCPHVHRGLLFDGRVCCHACRQSEREKAWLQRNKMFTRCLPFNLASQIFKQAKNWVYLVFSVILAKERHWPKQLERQSEIPKERHIWITLLSWGSTRHPIMDSTVDTSQSIASSSFSSLRVPRNKAAKSKKVKRGSRKCQNSIKWWLWFHLKITTRLKKKALPIENLK